MEGPPFLPLPQGLRIAGLHQEETMMLTNTMVPGPIPGRAMKQMVPIAAFLIETKIGGGSVAE